MWRLFRKDPLFTVGFVLFFATWAVLAYLIVFTTMGALSPEAMGR